MIRPISAAAAGLLSMLGHVAGATTPAKAFLPSYDTVLLRATQALLLANSVATNTPSLLRCAPRRPAQAIVRALMEGGDEDRVAIPGLAFGLTSLPVRLARIAFCVRPPPAQSNRRSNQAWRLDVSAVFDTTKRNGLEFFEPCVALAISSRTGHATIIDDGTP